MVLEKWYGFIFYDAKYRLQIINKTINLTENTWFIYHCYCHTHFHSHKFIKQYDTQPNTSASWLSFTLQSCKFLGSSTATVKLHVMGWVLVSYEKEILGTHFIVGRDFGVVRNHANAVVTTIKISCATWWFGGGKRWPNISFNIKF